MHEKYKKICEKTHDTKKAREYFEHMLAFTLNPGRLQMMIEDNLDKFTLIDVRDYDDYIKGHIPFAIHVPFEQLEEHLEHFSKDKINIFYGYSLFCQRGEMASYILAEEGYPVRNLVGGFKGWKKQDYDIVETDSEDYRI